MSTDDVPGMNPKNQDTLHAGCWAEHTDGTLIYVLGTENRTVLYELFELQDANNPVEYRDSMKQHEFEKQFSYDPTNPKSLRWTWHDKTLFPWDRVMKSFNQGVRPVSAKKQISDASKVKKSKSKHARHAKSTTRAKSVPIIAKSAAQQVADERGLTARPIEHADVAHMVERELPKGGLAARIRNKIQGAIDKLKVGE